jgi:hypothetical protein
MRRNIGTLVLAAAIVALLPAALASAQDLHKTYALGPGGQIQIQNISGDLKIVGYGGNGIVVDAIRSGRDKDLVQVEDLSSGNKIELRVRYPENGNCQANVDFEVKVPANVEYNFDRLGSVSGNVLIGNVRGSIQAKSVSGDVLVKDVSGAVNASSVSGNVDVEIRVLAGTGDMKFSSVSGKVSVKAPLNGIGDVEMSSLSGSLETDFPIQVQEKQFGPGRSAKGNVGGGASNLKISSISGGISLHKI